MQSGPAGGRASPYHELFFPVRDHGLRGTPPRRVLSFMFALISLAGVSLLLHPRNGQQLSGPRDSEPTSGLRPGWT